MSRRGLRHAGGTDITRCCGAEAIPPIPDDNGYMVETDDGTEISHSNFPDADLVCCSCGRTWGDESCEHDELVLHTPDEPFISDSTWVSADCMDCGDRVNVLLEVADVRGVSDE